MAGSAGLFNDEENGVAITVKTHITYVLRMARCLPFDPQLLARTAPIGGPARGAREMQCLGVHPCQHQDRFAGGRLHDRGNKPVRIQD